MKRALLINPWIYDFKAFDFWLKPLGLLYLASYLRQFNFEVTLIDCLDRNHFPGAKVDSYGRGKFPATLIEKPEVYKDIPRRYKRYGMPKEHFESLLSDSEGRRQAEIKDPDYIFITSGMTYWYPGVFEVLNILKRYFPKTPKILGGIYATICENHARQFSNADIVVSGRFEEELYKYIPDLVPMPFSTLPFPAYDLYRRLDYACLLTGRGCPFRCSYCAVHRLSPNFQFRESESVLAEIEYYRSLGIKNIVFYDDALLCNPNFKEILEGIIKRGWRLNFHTPNGLHPRFIDGEVASLLYHANFQTIYLSLETVSEVVQKETGGKVQTEEFLKAVEFLKTAGFSDDMLHTYLMIGLPEQRVKDVKESIDFVYRLGLNCHLAEFSPIPQTKEYEKTGLAPDSDPLSHNNTAFLYSRPTEEREGLLEMKDYLSRLRRRKRCSRIG